MKRTIIIAFILILFSCTNKGGNKPVNPHADTTKSWVIYWMPTKEKRYTLSSGLFRKVVIDTFKLVTTDSITFKREWVKDSVYFLPQVLPVDSLGNPTNDTLKIKSSKQFYQQLPQQLFKTDYCDSLLHEPKF